ncbi:11236_t:CDS:2, partial [Acaulospora morrowiae]
MSNVHTLKDIENREAVGRSLGKQIPPGRRLGSIHELELEKALCGSIKTTFDIASNYKNLQDFSQLNTANTELKAKYTTEIKSLKSNIKLLERETTLTQKNLSADKIKILFLEVKVRELEGKLEDIDLEPVEMQKLSDWLYDNLRSIVCKLGLEDKVMELDKKLAKKDILE